MVFSVLFCILPVIVLQIREKPPMLGKIIMLAKMLSPKLHLFSSLLFHNYFPFDLSTNFSKMLFDPQVTIELSRHKYDCLTGCQASLNLKNINFPLPTPPLQQQNCWFNHHLTKLDWWWPFSSHQPHSTIGRALLQMSVLFLFWCLMWYLIVISLSAILF